MRSCGRPPLKRSDPCSTVFCKAVVEGRDIITAAPPQQQERQHCTFPEGPRFDYQFLRKGVDVNERPTNEQSHKHTTQQDTLRSLQNRNPRNHLESSRKEGRGKRKDRIGPCEHSTSHLASPTYLLLPSRPPRKGTTHESHESARLQHHIAGSDAVVADVKLGFVVSGAHVAAPVRAADWLGEKIAETSLG